MTGDRPRSMSRSESGEGREMGVFGGSKVKGNDGCAQMVLTLRPPVEVQESWSAGTWVERRRRDLGGKSKILECQCRTLARFRESTRAMQISDFSDSGDILKASARHSEVESCTGRCFLANRHSVTRSDWLATDPSVSWSHGGLPRCAGKTLAAHGGCNPATQVLAPPRKRHRQVDPHCYPRCLHMHMCAP